MGTQLISIGVRGKYTELQSKEEERAYLYDSGRTNHLTLALMRGPYWLLGYLHRLFLLFSGDLHSYSS